MKLTDTLDITVYAGSGKNRVPAKETVPAKLYGPLALHKGYHAGAIKNWTVTHVATGLRVVGEIPLKAAVAIIKDVKDMPEWRDARLAEGMNAGNKAIFDKIVAAVLEAKRFHLEGGTRPIEVAA
jgi:hypothetical protein